MNIIDIKTEFSQGFKGIMSAKSGNYAIGENSIRPYEMLLGALNGCLYATFLDVLENKNLKIENAKFEIHGEKREEIPTTLKLVNIKFYVKCNEKDRKNIKTAFEISKKYCSIYQTISHVAQITSSIEYL